jgi:hypothetical protein
MKMKVSLGVLGLVVCLSAAYIAVMSRHGTATDKANFIVNRIYSHKPANLPKIIESMRALPAEVFPKILVGLYSSKHWREEGSSVLMGLVWPPYVEVADKDTLQRQVLDIIRDPASPMPLRRDLLIGAREWIQDDMSLVFGELSELGEPSEEIWLHVQCGASMLLRWSYGKAKRDHGKVQDIDELRELSEKWMKNVTYPLLKHHSDGDVFDRWTGKSLADFRRISQHELDNTLVESLSEVGLDASRQLYILDLICGWGEKSPGVSNYVKKLSDEAIRERKPFVGREAKTVKKLLRLHGQD